MTNFYQFHVHVFAREASGSFESTWEDAAALLGGMPRMIFEPDGSFVVSGEDGAGRRWQVDGHLFDFAGRLHRAELHGECPPAVLDELLGCVGWPRQPLAFELVREGLRVDEAEFRRSAAEGAPRR